MSTLIITLPVGPAPGYAWAQTPDGRTATGHGHAPAAERLPAPSGEVVALVPAAALSWHALDLPKGVGPRSPRLRQVLASLLEERLLDEPEHLHLALAPQTAPGTRTWVAACQKAWLHQHLHALEAAKRPVTRIVPELAPHADALHIHIAGEPERAELLATGQAAPGGVTRLPLTPAALAWVSAGALPDDLSVTAEPAVGALAEQLLQRRVALQTPAERSVAASRSAWDLAQFDLASSGRTRWLKRLSGLARQWRHAPQWRAARWGVLTLLLAHLVGLNAWAVKERAALQDKRQAIARTLTDTFPSVRLVVDAPVQMEREVAALRQATGAASGRDLEAMLTALGTALPEGKTISALDYTPGETRLKGLGLSAPESTAAAARLHSLGYATRADGDVVVLQQESAR